MVGRSRAGFGVFIRADSSQLQREFGNGAQAVNRFSRTLATTTNERLAVFSTRATQVGRTLTRNLTLPILAIGTAAVRAGTMYEEAFTRIGTLTGQTQQEIQGYEQDLQRLSRTTATTQTRLAQSLLVATSAGFRGAEATELTGTAARLAAIGAGELSSVTRSLTAVLENYADTGITAAEAGQVFLGSIQQGNFAAEQFSTVFARFLPQASNLGIEINQVGAEFAVLTRATTDGALASTQYSAALAAIIKPSQEARVALDTAGVSVDELRTLVDERGLTGALEVLGPALETAGLELANVFVDRQALNGVLTLTSNLEVIPDVLGGIESSAANVDTQFANASDTVQLQLNQALANLDSAFIAIGQAAIPVVARGLSSISGVATTAGQAFLGLSSAQQSFITQLALIGSSLGGAAFALGGLSRRLLQARAAYATFLDARANALLNVGEEQRELNTRRREAKAAQRALDGQLKGQRQLLEGRARVVEMRGKDAEALANIDRKSLRNEKQIQDARDGLRRRDREAAAQGNRVAASQQLANQSSTAYIRTIRTLNVVAGAAAVGGLLFLARSLNDATDAVLRQEEVVQDLLDTYQRATLPALAVSVEGQDPTEAFLDGITKRNDETRIRLEKTLQSEGLLDTFIELDLSPAQIIGINDDFDRLGLDATDISAAVAEDIVRSRDYSNVRSPVDRTNPSNSFVGDLADIFVDPFIEFYELAEAGVQGVVSFAESVFGNEGLNIAETIPVLDELIKTAQDAALEFGLDSEEFKAAEATALDAATTITAVAEAQERSNDQRIADLQAYAAQLQVIAEDRDIDITSLDDVFEDIAEGRNIDAAERRIVSFARANNLIQREARQSISALNDFSDSIDLVRRTTDIATGVAPSLRETLGLDRDVLAVEEAIQRLETSGFEAEIRARYNSVSTDVDSGLLDEYNQFTIDSLQEYFSDIDAYATLLGEDQDFGGIETLIATQAERIGGLEDALPNSVYRKLTARLEAIRQSANAVARGEDVDGGATSIADSLTSSFEVSLAELLPIFEENFGDIETFITENPLIFPAGIEEEEFLSRIRELIAGEPITWEITTTFTSGFRSLNRGASSNGLPEFLNVLLQEIDEISEQGGLDAALALYQAYLNGLELAFNPTTLEFRLGVPEAVDYINSVFVDDFNPNIDGPLNEGLEAFIETSQGNFTQWVETLESIGIIQLTPELETLLLEGTLDDFIIKYNNEEIEIVIKADTDPIEDSLKGLSGLIESNEGLRRLFESGTAFPDGSLGGLGGFATGGIVRRPTIARVGEVEPELILPRSRANEYGLNRNFEPASTSASTVININVNGDFYGDEDEFADRIDELIRRRAQING